MTAVEYVRPMESGRTSPLLVRCARDDASVVEVVVKFSGFCDQREENLAMEAVAACLAADLGLPIPEPFLVSIQDEWADLVPVAERKSRILDSSRVAFGSRLVTGGYATWTPDTRISEGMADTAAAIFVFDVTQNPDRRSENPNCLVCGENIRIIDHELAFGQGIILGWRPPWSVGGLNWLERKGAHIFRADLRRSGGVDYDAIKAMWPNVEDNRLKAYKAAVPADWAAAANRVQSALDLIRNARTKIDACLAEIQRVLS